MAASEVEVSGLEYLALATKLLQRARLADAEAGEWEAADLQWWWRTPRSSDALGQHFWVDDEGPVASVVLTDWGRTWECVPIVLPNPPSVPLAVVWEHAVDAIDSLALGAVEVLARDDDIELLNLLARAGFTPIENQHGLTWMNARDRPGVAAVPDGCVLSDREQATGPHPMRRRSGKGVEARLRQCSLYDPGLDLAIEASDGRVAGYALFWFDPVTKVGLVEPMRVEDEFQRRGLARALLTEGLDRLASRGARRLKVGYGTEAARRLYTGAGFRVTATSRSYRRQSRSSSGPEKPADFDEIGFYPHDPAIPDEAVKPCP
jgi:ribosomal protein S18 acetylase RimI-like enzyme